MKKLLLKLRYLTKPRQLVGKILSRLKTGFFRLFLDLPEGIQIQTPRQTLQEIEHWIDQRKKGVYLRFGDGDINLLEGLDDLLQASFPGIKKEMQEAFSLGGEGVFKCLPIHSDKYGAQKEMDFGLHKSDEKFATRLLLRVFKYFIGQKIYSPVALSHVISFEREYAVHFLRFLKSFPVIFVGNENVPPEILGKLFGAPVHIKTPAKDAFSQIKRTEEEIEVAIESNKGKYLLVVFAMGCSGRVLAKRLFLKGHDIFIFDFGSSLDLFCGWNTRSWMKLTGLPSSYFDKILREI